MLPFPNIRQSMLNLFCHCQIAFMHRYLEGEIIPPAIAARIGTGVHKAAEINHRQKIDSGLDMDIRELQEIAANEYLNIIEKEGVYFTGTTQELYKELGKGEDLAVKLTKSYGEKLAPDITPALVEQYVTAQHPDLSLPFSGTIDVVDVNGTIIDLKTAKAKWRAGKEKETTQPDLYKYMLGQELGLTPDFSFMVMAYNGETQCVPTQTGANMSRIIGIAKSMIAACESGVFMPATPGHWMCQPAWCGWYNGCKYR